MSVTTRQSQVQQVTMQVPPVRGLNTIDPIALMQPTDALEMDNFISADSGLRLRAGWYDYAKNIGGGTTHPVRTVFSFDDASSGSVAPPLAQSELFAATDGGIYLVEGGGDMSAVAKEIAFTGTAYAGRLSVVQFVTGGANFLIACSETDGGFIYDGVVWKKMTSAGAAGPGVITGVDPATFCQVVSWKKRLGFVELNSGRTWWLPVGQVGGAAVTFDFGPMLRHGGALLALISWTQDAGEGVDDYIVALGTAGDVTIYHGDDPTGTGAFENTGTWYIGQPPVGRRCFTTSGGQIYFLTEFGIIPIAQVVQGGLDNVLMAGTDEVKQLRKLQELLRRDFQFSINTVGWELNQFPSEALLHLARPALSVTETIQYAFHLHTLAWSRILDIPGATFYHRFNEVYAGTEDGRVLRVFDGTTDAMDTTGANGREIRARLTPAFSYFDSPAQTKRALMIRLNFQAAQKPAYTVVMSSDLSSPQSVLSPVTYSVGGSLWDADYWDTARWGGGISAWSEWRSVNAIGKAFAPTIFLASEQAVVLASLSYMIQAGGPL
jgi:hypothetical protein